MNALAALAVVAQREELLELVDDDEPVAGRPSTSSRGSAPGVTIVARLEPVDLAARDRGDDAGAQDRGLAAARRADDGEQPPGREPAR